MQGGGGGKVEQFMRETPITAALSLEDRSLTIDQGNAEGKIGKRDRV
ncbi:Uncharacterised protein [Serratia quinivorans]|nr:Uncharacterised protein [Serratia quinivorans]CAI0885553.1 Uncharacterised protein [Serratia quinivorans]CAI0911142.1 Uncharacterised protein [Serratia quinivorans]CAI1511117.1 Uncharacterised protein [Serratia quinivorans]CAI2055474.1 Uncharacterised protein [Serratia quinivorans]